MATEGHRKQQTWNDLRPAQPIKPNSAKRKMVQDFSSPAKRSVHQEIRKDIVSETLKNEEVKKKQIAKLLSRAHNDKFSSLKIVSTKTKNTIILVFKVFNNKNCLKTLIC